jgi:hypothetical protein
MRARRHGRAGMSRRRCGGSWHHCQALPFISQRPNALALKLPTGEVNTKPSSQLKNHSAGKLGNFFLRLWSAHLERFSTMCTTNSLR